MNYDVEARAKAAAKLAPIARGGKGQAVTITRRTGSGTVNTSGLSQAYRSDEIDGTVIQRGDQKMMLSALDEDGEAFDTPAPDDRLVDAAGDPWRIKAVDPFAPAGLAIYYDLQLRQG